MKKIMSFTIVSDKLEQFTILSNVLIKEGHIPFGELICTFRPMTYSDESYFIYTQSFVKYE